SFMSFIFSFVRFVFSSVVLLFSFASLLFSFVVFVFGFMSFVFSFVPFVFSFAPLFVSFVPLLFSFAVSIFRSLLSSCRSTPTITSATIRLGFQGIYCRVRALLLCFMQRLQEDCSNAAATGDRDLRLKLTQPNARGVPAGRLFCASCTNCEWPIR